MVGSEGTDEKFNFGSLISKLQVTKPDVIYFGGIYDQVGVFLKQLREKGVTVPVVGGAGLDAKQLFEIAGDGIKNTYYTTPAVPVSSVPAAAQFAALYKATYKDDPQGFSMFAYDAASVALSGMLRAIQENKGKLPTRAQVEQAVRGVSVKGLTGKIKFDAKGDRINPNVYVMAIDENKVLKLAK